MKAYNIGALLILLVALISLGGCESVDADAEVVKTKNEAPANEASSEVAFNWAKISGRHTQGLISSNSPIRIEFNRDVIKKDQIGSDASKVISLSPNVTGSATFASSKAVVFVPEAPLASGAKYTVDIASVGLIDIPAGAAPYRFNFSVIPLEFEVRTNALIASADTGRKMNLTGELLTSDRVMPDDVKRMLKASSQSKPLAIDWLFDEDGKRNAFTIRGEGDAQAAKIYADAYGKDAEFYSFYRSLEAYEKSFNSKSDIMVVKPDSDFFNYLKDGSKTKK